jgi:HAD superfamily hydrolase (TIGR01509 family)
MSDVRHREAVVFDVDGTLYEQAPVRAAIMRRLARAYVSTPVDGWRTLRALRAYRKAQEILRRSPETAETDVARAQIDLAARHTRLSRELIAASVTRWMEKEPLDLVARAQHHGMAGVLRALKARGVRLAALSDYPAEAKLEAMGIRPLFDVIVTAQDDEIRAFKPNPRGLRVALQRLGVTPSQALYVGDRVDVDARAAAAAGVRCVIISRHSGGTTPDGWITVRAYAELAALLGCGEEPSGRAEREAHELA